MRLKDRLEAERLGFDPRVALRVSYKYGLYRKTALVDNTVAAMWGVTGSVLSETGVPYLVTGQHCELISPVRFAKIYKAEVNNMLQIFDCLTNIVDASYTESVRLLRLTGFALDEPNKDGFQKFTMSKEN